MNLNRITEKITGGAKAASGWIRGKSAAAARVLANWRPDALMIAGAGGVAYGAWLVYEPSGFIVGGLMAMAAGWLESRSAP